MKRERLGLGSVALVLAGLAAAAPLLLGPSALELVGVLLIVAGVLDGLHSFRRVSLQAQRSAYASAGLTVLMGLLVLGAPLLVGTALTLLLAGSFLVDGFQRAAELRRRKEHGTPLALVLATLGNLAAAALLLLLWRTSQTWTASLAGALRIFGAGWNMVTTPVHTGGQAGSDVIRSWACRIIPRCPARRAPHGGGARAPAVRPALVVASRRHSSRFTSGACRPTGP
jgi:uncharacterized membrane protein HdeD (DUF308 family)